MQWMVVDGLRVTRRGFTIRVSEDKSHVTCGCHCRHWNQRSGPALEAISISILAALMYSVCTCWHCICGGPHGSPLTPIIRNKSRGTLPTHNVHIGDCLQPHFQSGHLRKVPCKAPGNHQSRVRHTHTHTCTCTCTRDRLRKRLML